MSRGTIFVYALVAMAILAIILGGAVTSGVGALLLGAYFMLIFAAARRPWVQLREALPERLSRKQQPIITAAAQNAVDAVPRSILQEALRLQDVGVVVDERLRGGLSLRRARLLSLDDESLRPYAVIFYPPDQYPRTALVRFEITDISGEAVYVYEMEKVLRPGENLIVPNYRLPLRDNQNLLDTGHWDLQLHIDDGLYAEHTFNVSPSLSAHARKADGEIRAKDRLALQEQEEALPLSLEDLLSNASSG